MPIELHVEVEVKNCELHTKASLNGGDNNFKAVSALHTCYCYFNNCCGHEQGYGCTECERKAVDGETPNDRGPGVCRFDCVICNCDCKCVFQEHNRDTIGIGIVREKKRLEEKEDSKCGKDNPSPEEMGAFAWTQFIVTEIKN